MRRAFITCALLMTGTANAATIVFYAPMIFNPAEIWKVSDPEMMTYEVVDGRPSFRRPGDEQCLEKFEDGPIPCDEVFFPEFPSEPLIGGKLPDPVLTQYTPPTPPIVPPVVVCCGGGTNPPPPPPPPPPVPLPAAGFMLLASLLGLFFCKAFMKRKPVISKKLAAANAAHDKFLRKMGVDPAKKPTLRGAVPHPLESASGNRQQSDYRLSDSVPGNGSRMKNKPRSNLPVAQVYHKGPIMVVTDMSTLDGSKRRN